MSGSGGKLEKSGSCAIVALVVNDECFVGNVGDSRAIMSSKAGAVVTVLSSDHRPTNPAEFQRILKNGGKVYRYRAGTIGRVEKRGPR